MKVGALQVQPSNVGHLDGVSNAVRFLASPESDFVTGQLLVVDGGRAFTRDSRPTVHPR